MRMSRKPLVIANTARSNLMPPKIIFKKWYENTEGKLNSP